MEKSSKISIYVCLFTIIPVITSLIMTPWFSFEASLMIYIVTPIYFVLMLLAIRYARKDLVHHSFRVGKVTARTVYIIGGLVPIGVFIIGPLNNILYTGLDMIVFVLWGIICILDIIAAFIYKTPE